MPEFPAVPTLQESGIDLVVESPYGIAGPRGMDPAVVAKLHDAFKEAVFDPAAQAIIARYGMLFLYGPSAGYEATTRAVYAEEQANLRRLGLLGSVK
jgi:tripartite-type tricarboxylate transporter receptor subunit TctC